MIDPDDVAITPKIARRVRVDLELGWRDAVRAGETPAASSGCMPVGWRPPRAVARQLELSFGGPW